MADGINKVILLGHLGKDAEVRNTQSGKPVMNLRVATSESWKDRTTGERVDRTEWHTVTVMNDRTIDAISQYLTKGTLVWVEGKLQTRKWQDQNGQDRYSTEIMVGPGGEIKLMGGGSRDGGEDRGGRSDNRGQERAPRGNDRGWGGDRGGRGRGRDDMEDPIPF